MESPSARSLQLLALLQTGRAWSLSDLSARLGASERTVRRDAQRLRELGYDVRSRPGPGATYRLHPGVAIPPLVLGADEVGAVVTGLLVLEARDPGDATVARTRATIERLLPHRLRRRAAATALATQVSAEQPGPVDWSLVGLLSDAVAEGHRVRFGYTDGSGRTSLRTVEPYRHLLRQGRWYLVAFDLDRDDWRLFRLDRVDDPETVASAPGLHPAREHPFDSLDEWLATDFGRAPRDRAVPASTWAPDPASSSV